MDDEQRGGGREHPAQGLLDQRLGVDVERRERVVEDEYGRAATMLAPIATAAAAVMSSIWPA